MNYYSKFIWIKLKCFSKQPFKMYTKKQPFKIHLKILTTKKKMIHEYNFYSIICIYFFWQKYYYYLIKWLAVKYYFFSLFVFNYS